jgi:hypothetical protein
MSRAPVVTDSVTSTRRGRVLVMVGIILYGSCDQYCHEDPGALRYAAIPTQIARRACRIPTVQYPSIITLREAVPLSDGRIIYFITSTIPTYCELLT